MENREKNHTEDTAEALKITTPAHEHIASPAPAPLEISENEEPFDEVGVISKETKVMGDIITKGHLEVEGVVMGNLNVQGDVSIKGEITGEISCRNLVVNGGNVKASIVARGDVKISADAVAEGGIKGNVLDIAGRVEGNVDAFEALKVGDAACIHGDINTPAIAVELGAEIQGTIQTFKK
ncbi:MAG: polymer-forming cytoskeletal protein [Clostridia bacterium]|nr:polymer-forming cytoskeletal protein [Clostridia bacterium]